MEVPIIKIGNSKGIRLPKAILEQYQIIDKVEMVLEENQLVLKPMEVPRKNWEASFQQMNQEKEDQLLIDDVFEDENGEEWN
jgi:antitoxin MazE